MIRPAPSLVGIPTGIGRISKPQRLKCRVLRDSDSVGVAISDECVVIPVGRVRAESGSTYLFRTIGPVTIFILSRNADESVISQRQSDVARNSGGLTVAFAELTEVNGKAAAFPVVLEYEIDYAGDSVGTILGRRAIPQYFYGADCRGWNRGHIHGLSARAHKRDKRGAMTPLRVDKHEGLVARHAAQLRRTNELFAIAVGLPNAE